MTHSILRKLFEKYPELASCESDIIHAFEILENSFRHHGKLLVCGNGGSAADSDHIVGELMKGFNRKRPLSPAERQKWINTYGQHGAYLADHLQGALPAISLPSHTALLTAHMNDVAADMGFAQQVYGYGTKGDVLMGISTSGNSKNVIHAIEVGRMINVHTIGLTGAAGGKMSDICDVTIRVPWNETADIQERHLPIYHALCLMLEEAFFAQ